MALRLVPWALFCAVACASCAGERAPGPSCHDAQSDDKSVHALEGVPATMGAEWWGMGGDDTEMIWVDPGEFWMGATNDDQALPREFPAQRVRLDGFFMDAHEVTNAQFAAFVEATGYVTVAERVFASAQGEVAPGSMVFRQPKEIFNLRDHGQWWQWVTGASWKHPIGGEGGLDSLAQHPVVHVAHEDAMAYAHWRGGRLPTEAEWEFAARGGRDRQVYPWGSEDPETGDAKCNIWEGRFPVQNELRDGFVSAAPVKTYPPNHLGFYDMAGNVWEWCSDWYSSRHYRERQRAETLANPLGPDTCHDPVDAMTPKRVIRGGSFLCNPSYCASYRVSARMPAAFDTGTNHIGFRCVRGASASD